MVIKIEGYKEIKSALKSMKHYTKTKSTLRLAYLAGVFGEKARDLAPVDTGRLKNSIKIRKGKGQSYEVIAEAPYAGFVEYGTSPHVILPKRKKVLRFEVNGRVVYARKVHHPGTGPKMFWRPSFEFVEKTARRVFLMDLVEAVEG